MKILSRLFVKTKDGIIHSKGVIPATRPALIEWMKTLPQSWTVAMEVTLFTGWIYDFLKPHAFEIKVAHPEMLKAITAAKKKNDQSDAQKICDLLRVDLLPECWPQVNSEILAFFFTGCIDSGSVN